MEKEKKTSAKCKELIREKQKMIENLNKEINLLQEESERLIFYEKLHIIEKIEKYLDKSFMHIYQDNYYHKNSVIKRFIVIPVIFPVSYSIEKKYIQFCIVSWNETHKQDVRIETHSFEINQLAKNSLKEIKDKFFLNVHTVNIDKEMRSVISEVKNVIKKNFPPGLYGKRTTNITSLRDNEATIFHRWISHIFLPKLEKIWKLKETSKKYGL